MDGHRRQPPLRTPRRAANALRCYYRPAVLFAAAALLLGGFWFASRYPQLLSKSQHMGDVLPSMAYGGELFPVNATSCFG